MAIDYTQRYPDQVDTDSNYPQGKARNKSTPAAIDGTPFEEDYINDQWGFFQALLKESGTTPSGNADNANNSDYLKALKTLTNSDSVQGFIDDTNIYTDLSFKSRAKLESMEASNGFIVNLYVGARASCYGFSEGDGIETHYIIEVGQSDRLIDINLANNLFAKFVRAVSSNNNKSTYQLSQLLADREQGVIDENELNIDCLGDSTMWGSLPFNTTTQDPQNSPVSLGSALRLIYPSSTINVTNGAYPGTTLDKLLTGTDGGFGTYEYRLSVSDADIVYCNHCLNDCNSYQSDIEKYRSNLIYFVLLTRSSGKVPVIVTPSMINPTNDGQEFQMKRMPSFIETQREVAKDFNVQIVDNFYYSTRSSQLFDPEGIATDGVHLSQLFNRMAGYNMAIPLINPIEVKSLRDKAGLSNATWSDTITNERGIVDTDSRFSSTLIGKPTANTQTINYPVLLDNPTGDNVILIGCRQDSTYGAKVNLTWFGQSDTVYFGGQVSQSRSVAGNDEDGLIAPLRCAMPAGLNIVGLMTDTSITSKTLFSFSGVESWSRNDVFSSFDSQDGYANVNPVIAGTEIKTTIDIINDETKLEILSQLDNSSCLSLYKSGTTIYLDTPENPSQVVTSDVQDGIVQISVVISTDGGITVKLGGITYNAINETNGFPRSYVYTSKFNYSLRYI